MTTFTILGLGSLFVTPAFAAWGQTIRDDDLGLVEGGEGSNNDDYYKKLILVHGIFAALVFLLLLPLSIITARYLKGTGAMKGGRWLYVHGGINFIAVLFLTITFVTGYYAVGTDDNVFDNVHHRIGLTVYVAILLQFFVGLVNAFVLYRPHIRTPIQNKIHALFGWLTWGLAIANIAVGMVLYGSPKYLIILYGVAAGVWLFILFGLEAVMGKTENHVKRDDYSELKVNWNGQVIGEKHGVNHPTPVV